MSSENVHESVDSKMIIDRVKEISGLTLKDVASQVFGISDKNLSNKIRRGSIDFFALIKWAGNSSVNLNWLLSGKGTAFVSETINVDSSYDIETAELVEKTKQVVQSDTIYGEALKTNIHSFHQAMAGEEKYKAIEERLEKVGCKHLVCIDGVRIRYDDPPQQKEEIIKRRVF